MPNVAPPPNPLTWLLHVLLVILAVIAAVIIVDAPNPIVGVIVLALVLGVELPVALKGIFGDREE